MFKNIAIWLVVALVLMTVFNQFSTRQTAQAQMDYSQFIQEVKQGQITKVVISNHVLKGVKSDGKHFTSYAPSDPWMVSDLLKNGGSDRSETGRGAIIPDESVRVLVPDAALDRCVDILHAPDAGWW